MAYLLFTLIQVVSCILLTIIDLMLEVTKSLLGEFFLMISNLMLIFSDNELDFQGLNILETVPAFYLFCCSLFQEGSDLT